MNQSSSLTDTDVAVLPSDYARGVPSCATHTRYPIGADDADLARSPRSDELGTSGGSKRCGIAKSLTHALDRSGHKIAGLLERA